MIGIEIFFLFVVLIVIILSITKIQTNKFNELTVTNTNIIANTNNNIINTNQNSPQKLSMKQVNIELQSFDKQSSKKNQIIPF